MADKALTGWAQRHPIVVFQILMWAVNTTMLLPAVISTAVPLPRALGWISVWLSCGVCGASLITIALARMPDRALRGFRGVATIVVTSIVAAAFWTGTMWLLQPLTGPEWWVRPGVPPGSEHLAGVAARSMLLMVWSGVFLINLLAGRVQHEREHGLEARAIADEAQLQLLRSQLNPHFLFNALNSVVALVSENPRGAQTMVRDIAALLRRSLDADGQKDATVREEVEFVQLYLKCEQIRFEERLRVTFDVADDVRERRVPPMLLHPLVENAVKHGLDGAVGRPLEVRVCVRKESGQLILEVTNTGSLHPVRDPLLPATTGIGVRSVRARLANLYPGRHLFELFEQAGQVIARVKLPEAA